MPAKRNPLNLNPLQLRTLTLLQEAARHTEYSRPGTEPGSVEITGLPHPHGDHFHLGEAVVAARDATGLRNPGVWTALERKRLVQFLPAGGALLTAEGIAYDTGLREQILHRAAD
jgi:hypothetical protein